MNRPRLLIGVLGTHTEVGKTWVSSHLLAHARSRGLRVAARKPVQSYEADQASTDAQQLSSATGEAISMTFRLEKIDGTWKVVDGSVNPN